MVVLDDQQLGVEVQTLFCFPLLGGGDNAYLAPNFFFKKNLADMSTTFELWGKKLIGAKLHGANYGYSSPKWLCQKQDTI